MKKKNGLTAINNRINGNWIMNLPKIFIAVIHFIAEIFLRNFVKKIFTGME